MESNTGVEVEGVEVGREKRVCRSGVRESEQPLIGREPPVTAGRPQRLQVKVSRKKEDQVFNWDGEAKRDGGFKTIVGGIGGYDTVVGESLVRHFLYLVLYTYKSHLAYPDIITNHGREKQN